ncbi:hypothetical protein [Streptomyces sp. NPDC127119]|uniref:hypothetical protein n=1 Tax=Streptomyces sp. NPDC127119 TaxID=3345370 RepID=UPI00363DC113
MENDSRIPSSVPGLSRRAVVGGAALTVLTTTGAVAGTARATTGPGLPWRPVPVPAQRPGT